MNVDKAKSIVVQQIVAEAIREYPRWESYPEIGENDWFDINDRVDGVMGFPPKFREAYDFLAARVNVGGESE